MNSTATSLLAWYDVNRRILPWRENPTVYWVWVSEVMLQQTQVDTGLKYFSKFIEAFPTVGDLAEASLDDVLTLWAGLGYYSRARNLHKAAKMVAEAGSFPKDIRGLRGLPGVGEYMAAAIASIALGQDEATVDGNIARVMARLHADPGPRKAMWSHARTHLPMGRAGDFNQALMDLGATICKPRNPQCTICPIAVECKAHANGNPTDYPPPKTRKSSPIQTVDITIHERNGQMWAGRRPEQGLWAGLWAFPEYKATPSEPVGEFRHILSHRRLEVRVWRSRSTPKAAAPGWSEHRWVDLEGLRSRGISALTAKCLKLYEQMSGK